MRANARYCPGRTALCKFGRQNQRRLLRLNVIYHRVESIPETFLHGTIRRCGGEP